ncbi:hypothetical protein FRC03_001567 [Tulasnella sp. 419]|nr:hypothetical protein FRC03_001567 [Tulasnella sp. 419]
MEPRSTSPQKYPDAKAAPSHPSRGDSWKLDCDYLGGLEDRAMAWTATNPLLLAHPYLPKVQGQFIDGSSLAESKSFEFPSPPPIQNTPLLYGPPTIISVAPKDRYVFAHFPASTISEAEGLGCIWQAGPVTGVWIVRDYWPIKTQDTVITCRWLGESREWYLSNQQQRPLRRPEVGPTLFRKFGLLLVTQSYQIHLVQRLDSKHDNLHHLHAPLDIAFGTYAGGPQPPQPGLSPNIPQKRCVAAAIGFAPDENSIIVASKIRVLPQLSFSAPSQPMASQSMEIPFTQATTSYAISHAWQLGDENETIGLCEIRVGVIHDRSTLETIPLPAIDINQPVSDSEHPYPPSQQSSISPTLMQLSILPHFDSRPVENQDTQLMSDTKPRPEMFVVGSFHDLGDGEHPQTPKSIISTWKLSKVTSSNDADMNMSDRAQVLEELKPHWTWKHEATRTFSEVASFIAPQLTSSGSNILVGLLYHSGTLEPGQLKPNIGHVKVFNPQLQDDERYESATLLGNKPGLELSPRSVAVSSNHSLLAISFGISSLSISRLPRQVTVPDPLAMGEGAPAVMTTVNQFADALFLTLFRNSDPSDIIRGFWAFARDSPVIRSRELLEAISRLLVEPKVKEEPSNEGLKAEPTSPLLGTDANLALISLAIALYKSAPTVELSERWSVGSDLLHLRHCTTSFSEANWAFSQKEFAPMELKSAPYVMSLLIFAISLCEKIVKEVTIWEAWRLCGSSVMLTENDPVEEPHPSNTLLLLLHPFATLLLFQLMEQLFQYQNNIAPLSRAAKTRVSEIMDGARVRLTELRAVIEEIHKMNVEEYQGDGEKEALRIALLTLSASEPSLREQLNKRTQLVNDRPNLAEKMALLLPDLDIPGVASERKELQAKQNSSPGRAKRVCFRCGIVGIPEWQTGRQCFCGGIWISLPQVTNGPHINTAS